MKRAILFSALLFLIFQASVQAQERAPLAMRIAFEWTAAGGLLGAGVGFGLWLTDPGNPNIKLSSQMARGASLGLIGGAIYGIYIMQRTAQFPVQPLVRVRDPLDPSLRLTRDPMTSLSGDSDLLAMITRPGSRGGGFLLPLLHFRF